MYATCASTELVRFNSEAKFMNGGLYELACYVFYSALPPRGSASPVPAPPSGQRRRLAQSGAATAWMGAADADGQPGLRASGTFAPPPAVASPALGDKAFYS